MTDYSITDCETCAEELGESVSGEQECECGRWMCKAHGIVYLSPFGSQLMCPDCYRKTVDGPTDAELEAYYNAGGFSAGMAERQATIQRELK